MIAVFKIPTQAALILGVALFAQLRLVVELVLGILYVLVHIADLMKQSQQRHINLKCKIV